MGQQSSSSFLRSNRNNTNNSTASSSNEARRSILERFVGEIQPDLSRHLPYDIGNAMLYGLSSSGTPSVPNEVFNIYIKQFNVCVYEGRQREEILRSGNKVSPSDYLTKKQKRNLAMTVIDMLPTSNVRILREILSVVQVVCLLWRPWEIGKREIRKDDNTLDNILPRFSRIIVNGDDVMMKDRNGRNEGRRNEGRRNEGRNTWNVDTSIPAFNLISTMLNDYNYIFGITRIDDDEEEEEPRKRTETVIDYETKQKQNATINKNTDIEKEIEENSTEENSTESSENITLKNAREVEDNNSEDDDDDDCFEKSLLEDAKQEKNHKTKKKRRTSILKKKSSFKNKTKTNNVR